MLKIFQCVKFPTWNKQACMHYTCTKWLLALKSIWRFIWNSFLSSVYIKFVISTLLPAYIDSRGIEPTFGLLKELGGWPVLGNNTGGNWSESEYNLTTLLLDLLRYNNKPLINLYVYTDSKNSTIRIIYVRLYYI